MSPDGSIYVAEFDGFWDAGPNANVSRYRWISRDTAGFQTPLSTTSPANTSPGEQLYQQRCASCHQTDGSGVSGAFPPLARTPRVNGAIETLVSVLLDGLSDPLEVDGIVYNGAMPPWRDTLSDRQIADLLSYMRQAWGNDASNISARDVARIRNIKQPLQ